MSLSWTNFSFNRYIYTPSLVLVDPFSGFHTNNAWTPPMAVHSRHVAKQPLWWWGGWAHSIVFMASLYMCNALCFVYIEHSVCHEPISVSINIYAPSPLLVEHSVGSYTNNAWTPPLTIHSRHVATKALWWWRGWAHWIVFVTSLYIYSDVIKTTQYICIYIHTKIKKPKRRCYSKY